MNKKDIQYLKHIIDEIDFLSAQCENLTLQDLMDDDLLQRASVRSLEVIGGAVKNLSEEFKKRHPSLEWKKIAGFRGILIHHYFGIDWELIWDVIEHKLPLLEKVIETSIKENGGRKKTHKQDQDSHADNSHETFGFHVVLRSHCVFLRDNSVRNAQHGGIRRGARLALQANPSLRRDFPHPLPPLTSGHRRKEHVHHIK